jgi:hypothetical protein
MTPTDEPIPPKLAEAPDIEVPLYEPPDVDITDSTLRRLIDAAEADPFKPGVVVTLYLPWGTATGQIASRQYFEQTVAGEVRTQDPEGDLGDDLEPSQGDPAPMDADDYVHLYKDTTCLVASQALQHRALRVRLADVTAWAAGHPYGRG